MIQTRYGFVFSDENDAIKYAISKIEQGYNIHYYTHINDALNIMSYCVEFWSGENDNLL